VSTEVVLNITGEVLSVPMALELHFFGAPLSLRLSLQNPISIEKIWQTISEALYNVSGLSLPDLTGGPWGKFLSLGSPPAEIRPSLWIKPTTPNGNYAAYLELAFTRTIRIGGTWSAGPLSITLEPNIGIEALYISYDKGKGGFDFKAKITVPTQPGAKSSPSLALTDGTGKNEKAEIVSYPFPLPSQGSLPTFQLHYLGLGQRVGPTAVVTGNDPMTTIFDQLENQLIGSDPKEILTNLANNFYHPDRNWFIAADVSFGGFRLRVLFNDPSMYGLELTAGPTTPLAGLLFEILYQKLGPNLGVYYGALTLPDILRRIVLEGVILILPGFSIWVYTNGDFKVNVGWPLGAISIGVQVGILVGIGGFYFAKLRSGDNPGAQPTVNYNPILEFGFGISVFVKQSFNASVFSATISVTVTATFQGLLAWYAGTSPGGSTLAKTPDHYWFAGTAGLAVLIQGSIDFSILKASVTISLIANVSVAFETGYLTVIAVSASVSVEISIKIIFFTIHLSFNASISHSFYIGSGSVPASINGPLAPGLQIAGGPSAFEAPFAHLPVSRAAIHADASAAVERLIEKTRLAAAVPRGAAGLRFVAAVQPISLPVHFVLQPTVVYNASPSSVDLIASLFIESPGPQSIAASPSQTPFEQLIRVVVEWLLGFTSPLDKPSVRFREIVAQLGQGSELGPVFGGGWEGFAVAFRAFIRTAVVFWIHGVSDDGGNETFAALLPMIDALALTYTGQSGTETVDFATFNVTPPQYPAAVNAYYEELSWGGTPSTPATISALWQASGSPLATPSMSAFLFYDYFLLQCRNAAKALLKAAEDYEHDAKDKFLARIESAYLDRVSDPWRFADLALDFRNQMTGDEELSYLLDHFDYVSAAGLGSRYLLQGLQLPVPSMVPIDPTPENMATVPTCGLYVLTGQQFAVLPGTSTGSATISISPNSDAPPGWIEFDSSSPPSSTSTKWLGEGVPPRPSPAWQSSPNDGGINLSAMLPLTPHPLYYSMKNQIEWAAAAATQTILPFPGPMSNLLAREGALRLSISTQPPDAQKNGSPVPELPAAGGLLIRLSLNQVPQISNVNVGPSGSPSGTGAGSPGSSAPIRYLPFVYQLNGTDEQTRDLIYEALQQDLSGATISLLYSPVGSGKLVSVELGRDVLLAKVNLSTLNQAPKVAALFETRMRNMNVQEIDFAPVTSPGQFLRLVWELSVVNASGFFLYYIDHLGHDLPAELFADAGVGGGQTAQFNILVQFGEAIPLQLVHPWQNCITVAESSPASRNTFFAALLAESGSPIYQYSPTYLPGNIGFDVIWKQETVSPEPPIPVDHLYQLIQFSIAAQGTYRSSVWSLPAGPTRNSPSGPPGMLSDANTWNYQQSVPVYRFVLNSPSTGTPYTAVGHTASLGFRLIDIYGNPLPDVHQFSFTPLYNDPLASFAEWPGVAVSFHVQNGNSTAANLIIDALFDPDTVVLRGSQSPPLNGLQPSAADQWQTIQARYELILCQLQDPHVTLSVTSSLVAGGVGDSGAIQAQLTDFATRILIQVQYALSTSASPDEWSAQKVSLTVDLPIPFASIAALPADIFPVNVALGLSREPSLCYPPAAQQLPAVCAVSYSIPPNLHLGAGSPPGSPGSGSGLRNFALLFESAFFGFDRASGWLKLAQRADIATGPGSNDPQSLWAVRWSATGGISVQFPTRAGSPDEDLVYFAVRPLSTRLMAGQVQIGASPSQTRNFGDVDIDAWAYQFLQAFDAFLTPAMSVAVAILDDRYGTPYFNGLMECKTNLARVVPLGLLPVFADQTGMGDIVGAQQRLQQAMLTTTASAYTVSTILQSQAQVDVAGRAELTSPSKPPQLYGSVAPPASGSPSGANSPATLNQYTLSPGELDIAAGPQWLTSLVSVAQPTQQAELLLPLAYQVSYLQHDFGTEEMGYTPSSWLKFVLAGEVPLNMAISPGARIPIPLMFYPDPPSLISQTASAANLGSPSGSPSIEDEIAAALAWDYTVELEHAWAAQDELFFEVTFNETVSMAPRMMALPKGGRSLENLFAALAQFHVEYPRLVPQFSSILREAFPAEGVTLASPETAQEIIGTFLSLANGVEAVWPDYQPHLRPHAIAGGPPTIVVENYYIQLDSQVEGRMHLFGAAQSGGPPAQWPVVTVQGQVWNPQGTSHGKPREIRDRRGNTWSEVTHDFSHVGDRTVFFRHITLSWVGLDIRQRQSAILCASVTRNADLVPPRTTTKEFIYDTETVKFANPVIPLIRRGQLSPLHPGSTLANTLEQIFNPISLVGQGLDSYMRVALQYEYEVAVPGSGLPLFASMPVLLADDISVGSNSPAYVIATEIAQETAAWYTGAAPSTAGAVLAFQLVLFGTVRGQQLPLVQIDQIPILVGAQPLTWWNGPA
jgi:hypothetical protein